MPQNSIFTYITGEAEILREPLVRNDDTEYICVTDNPNLRSKTWNVIYDDDIAHSNLSSRDRTALIKFNPFPYTTGRRIIVVDGSHQQVNDCSAVFDECERHGLLLKQHPKKVNAAEELIRWVKGRGLPYEQLVKFSVMVDCAHLRIGYIPIYEGCCIGINRTVQNQNLFASVIQTLIKCGDSNSWFMSNQMVLSFLVKYAKLNYKIFSPGLIFNRFRHNTWVKCNE